ncbi:MAG: hypothetical protein H6732_18575 [Alphaproteobacteria bacterium]|nr:hypothetical protein [Alphaproteobacteria bacterium]
MRSLALALALSACAFANSNPKDGGNAQASCASSANAAVCATCCTNQGSSGYTFDAAADPVSCTCGGGLGGETGDTL